MTQEGRSPGFLYNLFLASLWHSVAATRGKYFDHFKSPLKQNYSHEKNYSRQHYRNISDAVSRYCKCSTCAIPRRLCILQRAGIKKLVTRREGNQGERTCNERFS